METVVIILIVLAAVALVLKSLVNPRSMAAGQLYVRKLMSNSEQVLYFRLCEALPECVVLAQVEMTRVVGIRRGAGARGMWNRLRGMSLDYVVCLKDSSVVCAIELDDASHDTEHGRRRHEKKTELLTIAGVTLLRWNTKELPSVEAIRAAIS